MKNLSEYKVEELSATEKETTVGGLGFLWAIGALVAGATTMYARGKKRGWW
jgi:hypothetical protein